ncbi:hypothetical protein REPUB_Repub08aG0069200 [Reevesia pubescens]
MAPTAINQPSPNDLENFRNILNDDSKKNHCEEPGDHDGMAASPERRQWKSYERKLRVDLKEMLMGSSNNFAGLLSEATRLIYTRFDAELKRAGRVRVHEGDETEKKELPNQLGNNLEFWLFYACI